MASPRGDPEREVMALALTTHAQMVADVLRGSEDPEARALLRAIAATRSLAVVVDDTVHALVDRARASGQTWAQIGAALHVTRRAAFQRFGGGAEATPLEGASERALEMLELFLAGRFEELRDAFDARMSVALPLPRLLDARERARALGELRALGTRQVSIRLGYTIVDVPLRFVRGERTGQVAFNAEGLVSGLFILPAGEA
jgi:hypothetical protein